MKKTSIPQPLVDARRVLQLHPALKNVGEFQKLQDGSHIIDVDMEVPLPTRAQAKGQTASGVRALETVRFKFPPDYPSRAPRPSLRKAFPSNLPHIQPHAANERVPPCIFEGNLSELMHRFNFEEIVDQTVQWLEDAAKGFLIKADHGWEPTRRDDAAGMIRFDAQAVLDVLPTDGSVLAMESFVGMNKDCAWFDPEVEKAGSTTLFTSSLTHKPQGIAHGTTTVFFACAESVNGERQIYGEYKPDTVVDASSLLARATELGIDASMLERTVNAWLASCMQEVKNKWPWDSDLCFAIVLTARRPFNLVVDVHRDVEFIPYILRISKTKKISTLKDADVKGALHARELSPVLLAEASGFDKVDSDQGYLLLGCGSVGSKIAAHLGRAGFGKAVFLDNDHFEPHNTARHALHVGDRLMAGKAPEMQKLFESFGHSETRYFERDGARLLRGAAETFKAVLPPNCKLVLDATASLRVGAAAVASPHLQEPEVGRYCRAMLYGQGRVAVLLLEGPERAPRCDDLMAELFAMCLDQGPLRDALGSGSRDPRRVFIGDNCASFTMPMSDSILSRSTAMMGMQVENWLVQGIPNTGGVFVGLASGIGMQWQEAQVEAVTVLTNPGLLGWTVRLSARVVAAIQADANNRRPLETGGVLLGHVDEFSRSIIISALVDAPPDSTRSETEFKLGTQGLALALKTAQEDSIGYLTYVGTWHSHPMGGAHSSTDMNTLVGLAALAAGAPMVSLVWTSEGFHCALAYRKA